MCDRCEEPFPEDDLTGGPIGGLFCDPCLEIVVEIITDEEMI